MCPFYRWEHVREDFLEVGTLRLDLERTTKETGRVLETEGPTYAKVQ